MRTLTGFIQDHDCTYQEIPETKLKHKIFSKIDKYL